MPVGAVHGVRLVPHLLHVNFGLGVGRVQEPRGNGSRKNVDHPGSKLERAIAELLFGYDLRSAGQNLAAALESE